MANPRKVYAVVEEKGGMYGQKCIALDGSAQGCVSQSAVEGLGGWHREEGEASAETLASLPALRADFQAREEVRRAEASRKHAEDAETFKRELRQKYPWAKARNGKTSDYARASANLKKELSLAFPGVKFSVRSDSFSMGNSVDVSWSFGPTTREVDEIARKYQDGSFDGMEDIYNHDRSAFGAAVSEVLGRAKYVQSSRSFPQETYGAVQEALCELQRVKYEGPYTAKLLGENDRDPVQHHASMLLHRTSFPAGVETFARVEHVPYDEQNGRDWARLVFETAEPTKPEPAETPAEIPADVTRDGDWTWVSFPAKPPQSVIDRLKTAGARWSRKRAAWYFSRPVDLAEIFPGAHKPEPETVTLACDLCERTFSDESAELAADMLGAHKMIAHREPEPPEPDPAPYVPEELSDYSASVREPRACAEFRMSAEPKAAEQAGEVSAPPALTATRDTLRALKLINDAAVLEEKRAGMDERGNPDPYGRADIARVTLGGVETVINVTKLDKWAALMPEGVRCAFTLTAEGVEISAERSFIRFARQVDIPVNMTPIALEADYSVSPEGELRAPALPSPEEMKAARKQLAEGRKELAKEKARLKAAQGVNTAKAELRRCEEYAAKLEDEAREAIQRAEELTEAECDEAVTLARRVRDLRRLKREVERAAEDPQVNTPDFFEWLEDEHRAAYAEAFPKYRKAKERAEDYTGEHWKASARQTRKRNRTIAEKARKALGDMLRRAFDDYTRADVAEIAAADVEQYGHGAGQATVFGPHFDTEAQAVKRTLRRLPGRINQARERVTQAREKVRESLEAYEPHVRDSERERYELALSSFAEGVNGLARAA